ncbi:T9SS type A sorting domain-containing protein [bacterium]|nr:T9SS type A sorting domain-containing protein [bacterium]
MRFVKIRWSIWFLWLFGFSLPAWGEWQINQVGSSTDWFRDVTVTAGRQGSDTIYVYAANHDGYLYEYWWNGTNWQGGSISVATGTDLIGVSVGKGRNNGETRVYSSGWDGRIYEYYYNSGWQRLGGPDAGDGFYRCTVGFGRGESEGLRIYGANSDDYIYEYHWNGLNYDFVDIGTPPTDDIEDVAVGIGRNDSVYRVYAACIDNRLYEYTYEASSWNRIEVDNGADDYHCVVVGAGRFGSPLNSVFAGHDDGRVYEFTWSGSWNKTDMGQAAGNEKPIRGLSMGDGRNDGVKRVYAGCSDGHTYEYTWNGTEWTWVSIGPASSSGLRGLAVGRGRQSEGLNSVFAASEDHKLYEYLWLIPTPTPTLEHTPTQTGTPTITFTPTFTPTPTITLTVTPTVTLTSTFSPVYSATATATITPTSTITPPLPVFSGLDSVVVYPNPFRVDDKAESLVTFKYLPGTVVIRLYNLTGKLVNVIRKDDLSDSAEWDLRNRQGSQVASGVYLYVIKSGREERRGKLVLLR